ncbi:MAG: hypothetical protein AB7F86_02395 [Bdellovibrionales bacterium]
MKFLSILVLLVSAVVFTSCKTSTKTESHAAGGRSWPGQMQNMAQDVRALLPFVYDRKAYTDPSNREQILKSLKQFSQAAHQIPAGAGKSFLGDDLLVEYSLKNLKEDLSRAANSFALGQYDYSRTVAKASLNHCFRCHSATKEGGQAAWNLDDVKNLNLAPIERVDLLVATRKFDEATRYMEGLLASEDFQKTYAFDFESVLRRYLALMIRVENSPARAKTELDRLLSRSSVPHYIVEQADGWRKSLSEWENEKKTNITSASQLFKEVEKRFRRAQQIQRFEKDHAGDVEYLRATAALHQGMKIVKRPQDQARALFWLGRAYEVLDELGSWNLHESYYEACLMKDPKSSMAKSCYNRLEASLYLGYSGSSGVHLPPEEKERLERLKSNMQ